MPTIPDNITVELLTDQDRITKQDAAFYVGYDQPIAVIKDAENCLIVRCVGEMRVTLWESADCDPVEANIVADIRTADDLIRAGITDDEKLLETEDRLEWENNSWFALIDTHGLVDLDDTYHGLDDAIADAIRIVNDFPNE